MGSIEDNSSTVVATGTATAGGGVAIFGGSLLFNGGVVQKNAADANGSDLYVSSTSATDFAKVKIANGKIGNAENVGTIYVTNYSQLTVNGYFEINDNVILQTGAYIYVDGIISGLKKTKIVPTSYPTSNNEIKVVEFASTLTSSIEKFDIEESVKVDYRLKVVGQTIVICESYFNLTLDANGGDVNPLENFTFENAKDGNNLIALVKYGEDLKSLLTLVEATQNNRYFIEWNSQADGLGESYSDDEVLETMPYDDLTLYAIWSSTYYILTINLNDASGSTITEYTGESEYYKSGHLEREVYSDKPQTSWGTQALKYFSRVISREGYQFVGFCANSNGEGDEFYSGEGDGFEMPEHDKTLYVIWQANQYTIKYIANKPAKASKEIENTIENTVCTFDKIETVSAATYILPGWTQLSWNTKADGKGTEYALGASIKNLTSTNGDEIELFAIYEPNEYVVTYNGNQPPRASTTVTGSVDSTTHTYDVESSLNQAQKFVLEGYTQKGWNTRADGTGRSFAMNAKVIDVVTEGTTVLYAEWEANKYTVVYNSLGSAVSNDIFSFDQKYNLKTKAILNIAKQHHNFIGWDTSASASTVVFEDGAEIENLTNKVETITLYAVWDVYKAIVHGAEEDTVEIDANPSTGI